MSGNMLEASILDSGARVDTEEALLKALLGKELSSYWKVNKSMDRVKFSVKGCLMFLNLAMVYISITPDQPIEQPTFRLIRSIMLWTELVVVWSSAVRIPGDILLIRISNKWGYNPAASMQMLANNLEVASSFSMLEFMPVPSKVLYWISHRQRIWEEYFSNPPVMFNHSIWSMEGRKFWFREAFKLFHEKQTSIPKEIVTVLFFGLCILVVQVVVPVFLIMAPFLSFPAFLVKMQGFPGVTEFTSGPPGLASWIKALGIANQVSKMWSSDQLEKITAFKAANKMLASHTGERPEEKDAQEVLRKVSFEALGSLDGTVALSILSAEQVLELVYSATFGKPQTKSTYRFQT